MSGETPPPPEPVEMQMFGLAESLEAIHLEVRALIDSLDHEIGRRRMSLGLRLQIERVEELLPGGRY